MNTNATQLSIVALLNGLTIEANKTLRQGGAPLDVLRDLIDALPVAALVADDRGQYVLTNALASELTGYSAEELCRLSVWQLTPGGNEDEAETLWRAFRQQRAQRGDYQLLTKDGRVITATYAARANIFPRLHVSLLEGS